MDIKKQLLTVNPYSRPNKKLKGVKGVVIHYVGNPKSTAAANRNYFESLKDKKSIYASAHYIIGLDGEVIQCIPEDEMAYHVGAKQYTTNRLGDYPNDCTIGIECCHLDAAGNMTKATYNSLQQLTRILCDKYKLDPMKDLYIHKEVTGKHCHAYFVNNPAAWKAFKESIKVDDEHAANVKVLHEAGILGQPEAWEDVNAINLKNIKPLFANMVKYVQSHK